MKIDRLVSVAELPPFDDAAKGLFTEEERQNLVGFLALNPMAGVVMPDTGGIRKLRWAAKGKGKRGGARVIYFYHDGEMPLYLLTAYAKNEQIDLSPAERKLWRGLVKVIVEKHKARRLAAG